MFQSFVGCQYCNDHGSILAYDKENPSLPYAFRCTACVAGRSDRVRHYPVACNETRKRFAKWTLGEAMVHYEKMRDEKSKEEKS